ncbi:MAG: NADH-quinone oxidoreductase subunit NuoE [Thermacetogeniaceae bacterium]|jgi:NADH-quinone oxidoreductase subunit E
MDPIEGEEELIHAAVEAVLQSCGTRRESLIPVLQGVQDRLGYLPRPAMERIAEAMQLPKVEVFGVGTFYNQFRLNPPGKHRVKVCMGTACHMMGGHIILESFERRLSIHEGETTPDREYSLERVACVGCCALAPVVVVDEKVEARVSPIRVDGILLTFEIENKEQEAEQQREAGQQETGQQETGQEREEGRQQ